MELADELFLLKRLYTSERYYDAELDVTRYRFPAAISAEEIAKLRHNPELFIEPTHDGTLQFLRILADKWTMKQAADAFIAGLWSATPIWRAILPAKLLATSMHKHHFIPYSENSTDVCGVCGFHQKKINKTEAWFRLMFTGTPLDGEPLGYVIALEELQYEEVPVPTSYDLWTFRSLLTNIRTLPPKASYSRARDILTRTKLLPGAKKYTYSSVLEDLALMGILDTPEQPGLATRFTSYKVRDQRPNSRVEVQAPLAWWNSSIGINEATLAKLFEGIDCSSLDSFMAPTPVPKLKNTVIGDVVSRKMPRVTHPVSPDAGTGPVAAGDVYAVLVREGVWKSIYCHAVEEKYTLIELLEGTFSAMPMKADLLGKVQIRDEERVLRKVSGIDKATGVRRIARGVPKPNVEEKPMPDRIPYCHAKELKYVASFLFDTL